MFKMATRKNNQFITGKKVELHFGTIDNLKYSASSFDIIYESNVHFFWKNPSKEFSKLLNFIKPGGKLVIKFQPRWVKGDEELKKVTEITKRDFENAGFKNIMNDFKDMKPITCIFIAGYK